MGIIVLSFILFYHVQQIESKLSPSIFFTKEKNKKEKYNGKQNDVYIELTDKKSKKERSNTMSDKQNNADVAPSIYLRPSKSRLADPHRYEHRVGELPGLSPIANGDLEHYAGLLSVCINLTYACVTV